MKKLFVLLLTLLVVVPTFAQEKKSSLVGRKLFETVDEAEYRKKQEAKGVVVINDGSKDWEQLSAGYFLRKSSSEFMTAIGCAAGAAAFGAGSALIEEKDAQTALLVGSGLCAISSIVFGVKGVVSLGKAGKAMDREKPSAYIQPSKQGVGLCLNF
ncbi:MAG: hypothetical protein ACK5HZ_12290 [Macellibacteroides fermentans]|uniref:hypothetical protein n=1 Tax=Macellibacteroides fermentans TaxID=879969 RepID=UPI003ABE63EC